MKIKLNRVRVDFLNRFEAKEFQKGDGKFRYSATFLIEPGSDQDKAIQKAIKDVGTEKHKAKWDRIYEGMKSNSQKCCYIDGDTKTSDRHAGYMVLASHRQMKEGLPGIFDNVLSSDPADVDPKTGKRKVAVLPPNTPKIYDGCYVNGTVDIYIQEGEFPGVRATFIAVQYAGEGDAFSTNRPSADDFDAEEGAGAEDIT